MSPPRHHRQEFGPPGPWPVAVTIPARNEAERILACLDAARHALRGRGGIVVAVNGSQDRTLADAREWFERTGAPGLLLDLPVTPAGGVGEVRHLAVCACAGRLAPGAAVMTTDADSTVFPDWVDANLDELRRVDLVCGTVIADPGEFARLPPAIARLGAVEGEYLALTLAVRRLIDPVPHDPDPSHIERGGREPCLPHAALPRRGWVPGAGRVGGPGIRGRRRGKRLASAAQRAGAGQHLLPAAGAGAGRHGRGAGRADHRGRPAGRRGAGARRRDRAAGPPAPGAARGAGPGQGGRRSPRRDRGPAYRARTGSGCGCRTWRARRRCWRGNCPACRDR